MYIYIYIYIYAHIVVGFANRYELDSPWLNPAGVRFSVPVQTGHEVDPDSYTVGSLFLFPGVKQLERGVAVYFHLAQRLKKD
jgi:hypothetical protein